VSYGSTISLNRTEDDRELLIDEIITEKNTCAMRE
jgi:hypothetical protein